MTGVAYLGAGTGRIVSILADKPPQPKAWIFFACEAGFGAWLVIVNLL